MKYISVKSASSALPINLAGCHHPSYMRSRRIDHFTRFAEDSVIIHHAITFRPRGLFLDSTHFFFNRLLQPILHSFKWDALNHRFEEALDD